MCVLFLSLFIVPIPRGETDRKPIKRQNSNAGVIQDLKVSI